MLAASTMPPALDLPRLVMRRVAWVALVALLIGVIAGFVRAGSDIRDETRAALALATLLRELSQASTASDAAMAASLDRAQLEGALRHVALRMVDARGITRLEPAPRANESTPWVDALMALHARWQRDDDTPPRVLAWPVARPAEASPWMATLVESRDGERREAMANLGWALLIAWAAAGAMLGAMAWNVRQAFAPLRELVGRIAALRESPAPGERPRRRLPAMPVRELQLVADAVQRLDDDLEVAQAERRELILKLQTLQEDERSRLARELHDEFGQHLTALRVDLAWLGKRLADDGAAADVVVGMTRQCEQVQQGLRGVLARLRPLPAHATRGDHGSAALVDLTERLASLVASWTRARRDGPSWRLELRARDAHGHAIAWPDAAAETGMSPDLALSIYRMTQEALTNAARHADAGGVRVSLDLDLTGPQPRLSWSVEDDGRGLADDAAAQGRGSGLGGMRERAWAHGAELRVGPVRDGAARPGVRLDAVFGLGRPAIGAAAA
jgi:two-component system sensor histidine kinase UhpB